jgi:hypothetical protein
MPARVSLPYNPNPTTSDVDPESYSAKRGRPFLFQVVAPSTNQPLYPTLLALHVNPESLDERMTNSKSIVPTRGGWVEFRWPSELTSLSGSNTTGSFLSPASGLTAGSDASSVQGKATGRQGTIAWERQEDLLDLFHNNGMVFDGNGAPAIRGKIMLIYDRGIYLGFFTTFEVDEDDSHAFSFQLSWEFTVEKTLYRFPSLLGVKGTQLPAPSPDSPQGLFPAPTPGSQNATALATPSNNPLAATYSAAAAAAVAPQPGEPTIDQLIAQKP